jgi:hypothetical protein
MAALVRVTVEDPQNQLDTWGAGALARVERGTSAAMTDASERTTIAILATRTEYEYRDQTAVAGTHYFRVRYSTASPDSDDDYSGYSEPQLATEVPSAYTTPAQAKTRLNKAQAATTDDDILWALADSINAEISRRIGYFVGPSSATTRTLDGNMAQIHMGGRRIYVPGGIRTLTQVRIAPQTGGTWETGTLADFILGPYSWELAPGEPYHYVQITDVPAGSWSRFPSGERNVELTGTLGWEEPPFDLVELATRQLVRAYLARSSGQTDIVGSDEQGNALISRLWSRPDLLMLQHYRGKAFT